MRLRSCLSSAGLLIVAIVAMAIAMDVRVSTQSPFVVFGSNSGVAQPIKATSNALWVSLQGAAASITTPMVIGGTGTTSTLTLLPTSGNGTTGSNIIMSTGNNGSVEAMRILDTGFVTFPGNGTSGLTNFERATIKFASSSFQFITEHGGSGSARPMVIAPEGDLALRANGTAANGWRVTSSATIGSLLTDSDNAYDIGAAGATRPRTVYSGTSFIGPLFRSDSAKVLLQGTGTGATQVSTTQTTAPTCTTNCGTPGNVCVGTDTSMICTMGNTPASGFVIAFNGTWAAAPACQGVNYLAGMVTGKSPLTMATTTTQITVVTNGTAPATGDKYAIHCLGVQ